MQVGRGLDELRAANMQAEAKRYLGRAAELAQKRDSRLQYQLDALQAFLQLDAGQKAEAVATVRRVLQTSPRDTADVLEMQKWADQFIAAGLVEETAAIAQEAVLLNLMEPQTVEKLQTSRVKALLAANKPQEALAAAKSLYNASTMAGTANALSLVAKCLQGANPDNRPLLEKFRDEQVAGAVTTQYEAAGEQATPATQPAAVKCTALAAVKVDGKLYQQALPKDPLPMPTEEDVNKLVSMGNLLLLADRPLDARFWFEQAYRICPDNRLAQVTEGLARCMKAEDGTIGRANAWLLSLRPRKAN